MRLLILATDYPKKNESVALMYIHTRNKYYFKNGIDVTVLNFKAKNNYTIDGIKVITQDEYEKNKKNYDILVSHAPNLRNHYIFLKKHEKNFSHMVFFFHGHEVLKISETYPTEYNYMLTYSKFSKITRNIYDSYKLKVWRRYFTKNLSKIHFIFVSNWMYEMFLKYIKIKPEDINQRKHIIYNSIGEDFEINYYDTKTVKKYDFITIRNNLDGSKYCIDLVTKIALMNPNYKFCVVGKGDFFKYNTKPDNLEWIDKTLSHREIIDFLNKSNCALIPTRTDAQGVMACEMATFGIPLITSNIDVCREVFSDFKNVGYIDNEAEEINIEPLFFNISKKVDINNRNPKYFAKNTIGKEIKLFNKILKVKHV